MERVLEKLLQKVLEKAEDRLVGALEARLLSLLEAEEAPKTRKAKAKARKGAKAKAKAKAKAEEAQEAPEAVAEAPKAKAPIRRNTQAQTMSLEEVLGAAQQALEKFRGIRTKGGKDWADVLFRRVRAVARHAEAVGADAPRAVQEAIRLIGVNPAHYVGAGYTALARDLGLP